LSFCNVYLFMTIVTYNMVEFYQAFSLNNIIDHVKYARQ